MILIIVICVIIGLWLWKKGSENTANSIKVPIIDKNQRSGGDKVEEVVYKEAVAEDNIQQCERSHNVDEILKLKNKDFVFRCLYILSEKNRSDDIEKLTDVEFCKNNFNMYYAVLQEVNFDINDERVFMDNCGHRRYYPDVITLFNKKYIVCNDWFYNNKTNPRDTRTPFLKWVVQ